MAFNTVAANAQGHVHEVLASSELVKSDGQVWLELIPFKTKVFWLFLHPVNRNFNNKEINNYQGLQSLLQESSNSHQIFKYKDRLYKIFHNWILDRFI